MIWWFMTLFLLLGESLCVVPSWHNERWYLKIFNEIFGSLIARISNNTMLHFLSIIFLFSSFTIPSSCPFVAVVGGKKRNVAFGMHRWLQFSWIKLWINCDVQQKGPLLLPTTFDWWWKFWWTMKWDGRRKLMQKSQWVLW